MRIEVAGRSDRGTVRDKNEDHFCIGHLVEQTQVNLSIDTESSFFHDYGLLVAVADGMGGYCGGEVASRLALETLCALYYGERRTGCDREGLVNALTRYLQQTNAVLVRQLERLPEIADAGTTIAGVAVLPPDILVVYHVGDSRVLQAAAGYVRALTIDHTPLAQDIVAGHISEEEASRMGTASLLSRSLGRQGDTRAEVAAEAHWAPESQLLIGSDGWYGVGRGVSRSAIQELVRRSFTTAHLADELLTSAIHDDGQDNATIVVVRFVEE